ncbi:MAG: hypothetical protein EAX86_00760 [Candidatus Heimdallarchaeota archaeon]|nr:hypothetical protein [Candidatus Heimdallarchaeota archaeon]
MRERLNIESSIILDSACSSFSASHAIVSEAFEEGFHGHNYRIGVEIFGLIDNEDMIVDFLSLEDLLEKIVLEWDHYTLIPLNNSKLEFKESETNIGVLYGERYYSFPKSDIRFMKCKNITAEILAKTIALDLVKAIKKKKFAKYIEKIKIILWETAIYHVTFCIQKPFDESL